MSRTSSGIDEGLVAAFLSEHGEQCAEEVRLLEEERRFQREYAEEARSAESAILTIF